MLLSILSPCFLTLPNLVDLVESYSVRAIMAMGLLVVLIAGGIDISFAATASVAQYGAAVLATRDGLPAVVVIPAGLAIGTLLGCLNATLIHYARVTSIIVTIATMNTYFALLMYFTAGTSIYDLPDGWSDRVVFFQARAANGDLVRIMLPLVVMAGSVLLTWVLLRQTRAGRQLTAMVGVMHALTPGISNFSILAALAAGCLAALATGAVTGLLIARTRVHPILMTLGVMSIVQGVCILLTRGKVISGVPPLYGSARCLAPGPPRPVRPYAHRRPRLDRRHRHPGCTPDRGYAREGRSARTLTHQAGRGTV